MMRPGDLCRIVNAGLGSGRFCVVVNHRHSKLGPDCVSDDYDVLLEGRLLKNINKYFLELVDAESKSR